MSDFIKNLVNGDLEAAREEIHQRLYSATGEYMNELKKEVAASLYSDQVEEFDDDHLSEMAMTRERETQHKRELKRLNAQSFEGGDDPRDIIDQEDKVRATQARERKSKKTYGIDGRVIKEGLKGNQPELDKKPPYGELTRADFAALRATKKKK